MAGTYMLGETKVRPGSYFNIQKKGDGPASGAKNGIVGVLFKSDWGPLNQAVEVSVDDGYENILEPAVQRMQSVLRLKAGQSQRFVVVLEMAEPREMLS